MNTLLGFIYLFVILSLYFCPYIVAWARGVEGRIRSGVLIANLFLGWTVLGWVGALIWAASAKSLKDGD